MKTILIFLFSSFTLFPQVNFDNYFKDKTLRVDYFHTGDSLNDSYSIDELKEEPYWGGSKTSLIDSFNYGRYEVKVYDQEENKLIFSHTYSTLFDEWQTTDEARHTVKTFSETFTMPFPKEKIRIEFYSGTKRMLCIRNLNTASILTIILFLRKDSSNIPLSKWLITAILR